MRLQSAITTLVAVGLLGGGTAAQAAKHPYVVVIDAGHGGLDPGALSPIVPHGEEKAVTLAIALAVRDRLRGTHGVHVVLTRNRDRFLSLVARRNIGETNHADLFLSIHADSASDSSAGGASLYTLREDGRLVVVERMATSDRAGVNLDADTVSVLEDLRQRGAMNSSAGFAATLAIKLSRVTAMRSQPRLSAHFAVLKAEGVPAVLLETGYLTNEHDAALLFSNTGRKTIAKAIADAIEDTAATR
jgi:N-acetylmuramoyl-L-alanine amidase